jgi:hypothetical protein
MCGASAAGVVAPSLGGALGSVRHPAGLSLLGPNVPTPGSFSELRAVNCISRSSCWAVGGYSNSAELNQALHWNGKKWSRVRTPNPGGTSSGAINELFGVRCLKSNDCWAVGGYFRNGAQLNQTLHWNGKKWTLMKSPDPEGKSIGHFNVLADVRCTSANNCWAVGQDGVLSGLNETIFNQILHWNGKKWSQAKTPNPGGTATNDVNALESVECESSHDCFAVGTYGFEGNPITLLNEVLHWNGKTWSKVHTPNPDGNGGNAVNTLSGVSCVSARNCWAVGAYGSESVSSTTLLNQALHWNGKKWSLVDTPNPDGAGIGAQNGLFGVTCTSARNCWGVGFYGSISGGVGVILNEALRWNGHHWSQVNTPNPGGTSDGDENKLYGVSCGSKRLCWTVGLAQKNGAHQQNQALSWNGKKWSTG